MKLALPFGRAKRAREAQRRALLRGEEVGLDCLLRRTSARGWGPWTDARLVLGPVPDGALRWHVEDPVAVGLPVTRGPVESSLADGTDAWARPVRFRTEAFWGMDAEILVVVAERTTTELALPPDLTGPTLERLRELLGLPAEA